MSTLPEDESRMSDEEYLRRLRARFVERGGEGAEQVADCVTVETWREDFENDPEGAADEDMSYWSDDGE